MKFFNTNFIDDYIDSGQVERAIQIEMDRPGRLLGYRSLHKKLRKKHGLNVSRNLVYRMLQQINPEVLEKKAMVDSQEGGREIKPFHRR